MSSGKVKCTCGWSWNKSDSSKKDMYICHECGRDNSNNMKNGGWLDSYADGGTMQEHQENYNDYKVSAPEGMVGDGFSNVGRNYSPAWGGQFQTGGSLPGATGSMYARIGAPSKGPRRNQVDVTDASAQNGQEMRYYQEGLDWQPKTISRNGGWLDGYEKAQGGTETTYPWSPGSKSKGTGNFLANFKNQPKKLDPKLQAALDKVKAKFPSIQPQPKDEVSTREVFTATNDNILNASNEAAKVDEKFAKQQKYEANVKANQAIAQRAAQRKFNALPKKEQERILYEQYAQKYGTITQGDEPDSKLSKFAQSLVLPMTALKDLYHTGEVRDDLIRSVWNNPTATENNPLDAAYLGTLGYIAAPYIQSGVTAAGSAIAPYMAANAINPITGATLTGVNLNNIAAAGFAGHGLAKVGPDATKFADRPSWENLGNIAWDVADIVPIAGRAMKTMGEGFTSLRNMQNINSEGKIFSGMNNELNNMAIQNTERYMAKRTPSTSTLSSEMEPYVSRYTKLSEEPYIPYQEDKYIKWFNEQKAKMNPSTPVQDSRSVLRSSSVIDINDLPDNIFKSEIDWGKWNKEIPENTQLMKEYNAIEQTTKANGSWMKNPDGSAFQGTPEQFVQQNSKNFKKAFGNSKLINPDGSPTKLYHGTQSKLINDEFNLDYFGKTDPGFMGRGVYLSGHKGISHHYAYPTKAERINGTLQVKDYLPGEAEKLFPNSEIYEVYGNVQNPINLSEINTNDLYKRFNRLDVEDNLSQYDAAIHDFKRKDGLIQEINIADPKNIKSATGNNGMFDMTNPNIYKTIVPGAIGVGAASQMQDEEFIPGMKQGGIIKDDRGQWAYPGEITEINSNDITMQGVPYDVLGISDTGDTKLMKPGKNYKFKGKKVTEFPMAKNGMRQEQKGLVNLDQLTNFTNYNKPQPGGWLNKYN